VLGVGCGHVGQLSRTAFTPAYTYVQYKISGKLSKLGQLHIVALCSTGRYTQCVIVLYTVYMYLRQHRDSDSSTVIFYHLIAYKPTYVYALLINGLYILLKLIV